MHTTRYIGVTARKAPPTRHHVPAIWECMLGTVYARDSQGHTRYFDYDYEAARAWAGVWEYGADIRLGHFEVKHECINFSGAPDARPYRGQKVLWIRRPVQSART